jgi:hypothetical protein
LGVLAQGSDGRLGVIAQQLHRLINQLPFVFRAGGFIMSPQLCQPLFPGHLIHVFIHSSFWHNESLFTASLAPGNKTFGTIRWLRHLVLRLDVAPFFADFPATST